MNKFKEKKIFCPTLSNLTPKKAQKLRSEIYHCANISLCHHLNTEGAKKTELRISRTCPITSLSQQIRETIPFGMTAKYFATYVIFFPDTEHKTGVILFSKDAKKLEIFLLYRSNFVPLPLGGLGVNRKDLEDAAKASFYVFNAIPPFN